MRTAVILLILACRAFSLPALVQKNSAFTESGATSLNAVFTSNNTAGNCLVSSTVYYPPGNTSIVTDTQGNIWHRGFLSNPAFHPTAYAFWYAPNVRAGANTVTVSNVGSGQAFLSLGIAEISGLPNCTVDQTSELNQSLATNWSSGAKTTLADGELIIGLGTFINPPTSVVEAGSGFTQLDNIDGDMWEYFVQTTKGSIAALFTTASPVNSYAYMVTLYSAPIRIRTGIF